jgi:hypothetical protein
MLYNTPNPKGIFSSTKNLAFFFFLVGLGFKFRASHKQPLYHLSHTSSTLCFDYFEEGSLKQLAQAGLEPQSFKSQPPK